MKLSKRKSLLTSVLVAGAVLLSDNVVIKQSKKKKQQGDPLIDLHLSGHRPLLLVLGEIKLPGRLVSRAAGPLQASLRCSSCADGKKRQWDDIQYIILYTDLLLCFCTRPKIPPTTTVAGNRCHSGLYTACYRTHFSSCWFVSADFLSRQRNDWIGWLGLCLDDRCRRFFTPGLVCQATQTRFPLGAHSLSEQQLSPASVKADFLFHVEHLKLFVDAV